MGNLKATLAWFKAEIRKVAPKLWQHLALRGYSMIGLELYYVAFCRSAAVISSPTGEIAGPK